MMNIGAVMIAAGCGDAILPAGGISVAQRMVASFQKAGIELVTVVTGPEDKKLEKQLAQYGILFLRCENPDDKTASIRIGLAYTRGKCDRLFLLSADRPLLEPETLRAIARSDADIVIPVHREEKGKPVLLSARAVDFLLSHENTAIGEANLPGSGLQTACISVNDPGILLPASDACKDKDALAEHDRKLTRPVLDLTIFRGKPLLDRRLVVLLYLISETQSVRDACGRMQISYSTAWNMLNSAEEALGYPLLLRNKGGPSGNGSQLTHKGKELLKGFEQFETAARENMEKLFDTYLRNVL